MISAKFFTVFAGLAGSIGIALSAAAAHNADLPNLGTAANMLLFHAPVFLVLGLSNGNKVQNIAGLTLASGLLFFTCDLMARAYLGNRLFPMAAPIGGLLMIGGWLGIAASFSAGKKN